MNSWNLVQSKSKAEGSVNIWKTECSSEFPLLVLQLVLTEDLKFNHCTAKISSLVLTNLKRKRLCIEVAL